MKKTKRPVGRPRGIEATQAKTFRLRDEDADRLTALKKVWGSSEVAVIRRLLLEAARREGIEGEAPRDPAAAPNEWQTRFEQLLAKAHASDIGDLTVEEIEREVTLAREEVWQESREAAGAGGR